MTPPSFEQQFRDLCDEHEVPTVFVEHFMRICVLWRAGKICETCGITEEETYEDDGGNDTDIPAKVQDGICEMCGNEENEDTGQS